MEKYSVRDEIIETVNKLFVYTDMQKWDELRYEVFSDLVMFDMSSLGGPSEELSSRAICELWQKGFEGIDHIHHHAGNYIVHMHDSTADVTCYATATHYKANTTQGNTRNFVGSYELHLMKGATGWRIYEFRYILKFITGNRELR